MEKISNYLQQINALLARKGIHVRKHASTIADILGLQYNSAKQKLDGKRGITFDEVKRVFHYFNESYEGQRNFNGVFILNNIHKRCNIEAERINEIGTLQNESYALKKDGLFIIEQGKAYNSGDECYKVNAINFLSAPKIAILDNDNDILDLLKKVIERYGIESDTFQRKADLSEAIKSTIYEAYIFDWLLDYNDTPEELIKTINEDSKRCKPIMLLTGQLDHYERNIGEMILKYDVKLIEKPAKPIIISSLLLSWLFFN